jgi:hypothetical protein
LFWMDCSYGESVMCLPHKKSLHSGDSPWKKIYRPLLLGELDQRNSLIIGQHCSDVHIVLISFLICNLVSQISQISNFCCHLCHCLSKKNCGCYGLLRGVSWTPTASP